MKNFSFIVGLFLISMTACVQAPDSDKATVEAPKEVGTQAPSAASKSVKINTDRSRVTWIGTKPTGRHTGTINIADGELSYQDAAANKVNINGGKFTMDMPSLKVLDMDEENNNNLANHLKSDDFFKVEKHPTATFEITNASPYDKAKGGQQPKLANASHTITGNLTLLGTTKSVSFPAKISKKADGGISATANFNINRTDWGVTYGSDQSLGDKFIRPTVNIGLTLSTD